MVQIALAYVPSRAIAEEVVQDAWLGVLTGVEPFEQRSQRAPSERLRFEAHVRTCAGCAAYIGQMRTRSRLLGKLSEESMSMDAGRDLLAAFRSWKAGAAKRDS